jgi:hypothetical protein
LIVVRWLRAATGARSTRLGRAQPAKVIAER